MSIVARLEHKPFHAPDELAALLASVSGEGAVVSFVGVARPADEDGVKLERLVLEPHPRLTLSSIEEIAVDAAGRFEISHVRVVHRCGEILPGEPIVFAGAGSLHRRAAFEAADYLMDRLKTEAVLWKREESASASRWVEPTEADYADRGRWE